MASESKEVPLEQNKMTLKNSKNNGAKDGNKKKGSVNKMAKGFGISEIDSLLKLLKENDVTSFKLEKDGEKISLQRGEPATVTAQPVMAPQMVAPITQESVASPQAASSPLSSAPKIEATSPQKEYLEIKSPMVGTFYTKPSPDADSFVNVGDTISKGSVVCIIEAMKIMNEIESDFKGRVVEICVEDGQMAEYEETLFKVEPL